MRSPGKNFRRNWPRNKPHHSSLSKISEPKISGREGWLAPALRSARCRNQKLQVGKCGLRPLFAQQDLGTKNFRWGRVACPRSSLSKISEPKIAGREGWLAPASCPSDSLAVFFHQNPSLLHGAFL